MDHHYYSVPGIALHHKYLIYSQKLENLSVATVETDKIQALKLYIKLSDIGA
jgi:hypothetical protein